MLDGEPDAVKIQPLVFATGKKGQYHALGRMMGGAYSVGRDIR